MTAIGRWIGLSHMVGGLMSYCIMTQTVTVISRTTVQCLTSIYKYTDKFKASVSYFDTEISRRSKEEEDLTFDGSNPNPEYWLEYLEYDPDFWEGFDSIINDSNVLESDADFTPDIFYNTYLNMELEIPRYGDGPGFAKVTKRLRDKDRFPIGRAHNNPILDTRMY